VGKKGDRLSFLRRREDREEPIYFMRSVKGRRNERICELQWKSEALEPEGKKGLKKIGGGARVQRKKAGLDLRRGERKRGTQNATFRGRGDKTTGKISRCSTLPTLDGEGKRR